MRKLFAAGFALLMAVPAVATAADNLVEVIASSPKHQTLYAAIKAADLGDALKAEGPFTVLAPTDDAFAKLPSKTLDSLLEPANKDKLAAILKYHVIPKTKAMAKDVAELDGKELETLLKGKSIPVKVEGKTVYLGKAKVTKADLPASNGVIHVIDTVLMPPEE